MEALRTWREMREWQAELLLRRTGEDVAAWNGRLAEHEFADRDALRAWLAERGVTGYAQTLLVHERFGYPDFLLASADELLDGQYADRPHLRAILEAVVAAAQPLGEVTVQARKTFVTVVSPRRTFAVVRPTTRSRVDLGLRLDGQSPGGRLRDARSIGSSAVNVRMELTSPEDLDEEAMRLLERAYRENS